MINAIKNEEDFYQLSKNGLVALYVHADWCGPCQTYMPIAEKVFGTMTDKITAFKAKVEEISNIVNDNNITTIPTILIYRDGIVADKLVGSKSEEDLTQVLKKL